MTGPADRTTLIFTWDDSEHELSIALAQGSRLLQAQRRTVRVRLAGQEEAESRVLTFDGASVQRVQFPITHP